MHILLSVIKREKIRKTKNITHTFVLNKKRPALENLQHRLLYLRTKEATDSDP
jgi:hypothetical protein